MFYKILFPTDFSEASYEGLKFAADFALKNNAELCVLHVQPLLTESTLDSTNNAKRYAATVATMCAVIEKKVPIGVDSHPLLKQGEVIQEIRLVAEQENVDLIVLTAHATNCHRRGRLGKVTSTIIGTAPCPVLTINVDSSP